MAQLPQHRLGTRPLALVSPHTLGTDVQRLQNLLDTTWFLREFGFPKLGHDGEFGPETSAQVWASSYWFGLNQSRIATLEFQRVLMDPNHAVGHVRALLAARRRNRTRRIRARQDRRDKGGAAANYALHYAGRLESGDNTDHGGIIDTVEREAGIPHVSYCGAGVIASWRHGAGIRLPLSWVYVPTMLSDARAGRGGHVVPLAQARRGYPICWDWDGNGVPNHTGMYLGRVNGAVRSVDWNTGCGGPEGIHVCVRPANLVLGVVRPAGA